VLIAESSMKSKIRINDYNNFRNYNVRKVVFDTSLLSCACKVAPSWTLKSCSAIGSSRTLVLITELSMKWQIRMNDCNNFRSYDARRVRYEVLHLVLTQ
jgi:hypothetical protein